jgi:hypothetical protein
MDGRVDDSLLGGDEVLKLLEVLVSADAGEHGILVGLPVHGCEQRNAGTGRSSVRFGS